MMKNSKITEQEVEQARKQMREMMDVVTPKHLYDYLNEHVIGQDEAKKIISVVIYNHYKRFCDSIFGYTKGMKNNPYEDVTIEKTSALILGNTGSGKTYMLRMLANLAHYQKVAMSVMMWRMLFLVLSEQAAVAFWRHNMQL